MIDQKKVALDEYFKNTPKYHERIDTKHGAAYYWRYSTLIKESILDGPFLDVACGTGWMINHWAVRYGSHHIGIDISIPGMILAAQNAGKASNGSFVTTSGSDLPFSDGVFATVGALTFLEHSSDPFQAISEMMRVLRPGGRLVLCHTNFLSPFAPHVKRNKWVLIASVVRNLFLWGGWKRFFTTAVKLAQSEVEPWFIEPYLDSAQIGENVYNRRAYFPSDPDAIFLVNPIDLTRILKRAGMQIEVATSWGAYTGWRQILNQIPYLNIIGPGCTVVARKPL